MSQTPLRAHEWFEQALEKYAGTADFLAERVIYAITERIVEELEAEEMSRADLARLMGVSPAYISRLLNGSPNLTIHTLARVAHALNLDLEVDMPRKYLEFLRRNSAPLEPARTPKGFSVNEEAYAGSLAA